VAVQDEAFVGFAAGHLVHPIEEDDPAAQLIALVIAPRHERTGAGTALVDEFEGWARSNGARRALVNSGEQRRETHTFYEHRGYTSTGLRFNKTLPNAERKTSVPSA
jgi:GNAT superfamily N-acetyltransferase